MFSPRIERALDAAIRAHEGQHRKSGGEVPYAVHPLHVALMLARWDMEEDVSVAGDVLQGDVPEQADGTMFWYYFEVQDASGLVATSPAGGSIFITGSSTVEPITNLLAESFSQANPDVAFSVQGPGSGDGHKAACAGEVPIDGISVITSIENTSIDCLDFADLYSLIGDEATGFGSWSDANVLNADLGGNGPFPDADLEIFAPGEESGTFDSFVEIALEDIWDARVEAGAANDAFAVRPDYNTSADDNVIIDGIGGNASSLGWVGFAFADENRDRVKLLEIDGGDGCVAPTAETIASAAFPISRFLYTYVDAG